MTKDEALTMALEQLEFFDRSSHQHGYVWQKHLITAIKEALAQEQDHFADTGKPMHPEPAAYMYPADLKRFETSEGFADAFSISVGSPDFGTTVPLFTAPPKRQPLPAQPEQEPVAWLRADGMKAMEADEKESWIVGSNPELVAEYTIPLFTSPPQRQPLTEEQLDVLALDDDGLPNSHLEFARAIEATHGIGNKT